MKFLPCIPWVWEPKIYKSLIFSKKPPGQTKEKKKKKTKNNQPTKKPPQKKPPKTPKNNPKTPRTLSIWWIKTLLEKKICDGWVSAAERQRLMGKRSQPPSCFLPVLSAALVPSWTLQHPVWVTAGPASHRGQLALQNNAPCFAKHIKCHC